MSLFNPDIKEIKVNISGEQYVDYLKYKDSRKRKFTKDEKIGYIAIGIAVLSLIILAIIIDGLIPKQPVQSWCKDNCIQLVASDWDTIAKSIAVKYAPMIIILIGAAWVIHGFGFIIIKR